MDELLDIVNDEDQITGQEMRSIVHQLGLQHRATKTKLPGRKCDPLFISLDCNIAGRMYFYLHLMEKCSCKREAQTDPPHPPRWIARCQSTSRREKVISKRRCAA